MKSLAHSDREKKNRCPRVYLSKQPRFDFPFPVEFLLLKFRAPGAPGLVRAAPEIEIMDRDQVRVGFDGRRSGVVVSSVSWLCLSIPRQFSRW